MTFKTRINSFRRKLMKGLTKNVGSSSVAPKKGDLKREDVKNVLIIRPNHRLGNQLLLTPLVQEVLNTFPNCQVDLFVKGGVAHPVFQNYDRVDKIIKLPRKPFNNLFKYAKSWLSIKGKPYDLVINGDKNSSSGRLLTKLARAKFKIFGEAIEAIQSKYDDYEHISKCPIYNLRYYLEKADFDYSEDLPVLDIKLSEIEIAEGKKTLKDLVNNDKKTICIYTNATGDKCYSETWWDIFYQRLLKEFPEYNIIEMLPIENISKINFKATNFYSKDIREMGGILHNTAIFIAADNGVMHLASASLVPTIGFFSVTNEAIYRPYGNGSMALNTNNTNIEDWFKAIKVVLC
ncbi:glycosyltransferase family 9 protein [Seonamhaeicola sediminis]|uniref:Glycosyltransferase family 9 protein n=1 Tax=Seonamhaeicola sediminis TaxID=2528206 RepID=A0A562YF28_9FLAO|nr:glycosyltransferase family 9 protein [Seonamhaeicola sediminis]TWO32916.1 glycosyltransferase family 9 protein [Seonamhaeicola sediminis]